MNRIVDIHCHILPAVDDGSKDIDMSLEMLRIAASQGVTDIIATPHDFAYEDGTDYIYKQFIRLKEASSKASIPISLYLGCEIFCDGYSMPYILEALEKGELLALNDTRYVLTEFDPWGMNVEEVAGCLQTLIDNDWVPVIAHAERYDFINNETAMAFRYMGAKIQVNAYSLGEERNEERKERAVMLLEGEFIDFLGSDSHRTTHRAPRYERGVGLIYKVCEQEYAEKLVFGNAESLLL